MPSFFRKSLSSSSPPPSPRSSSPQNPSITSTSTAPTTAASTSTSNRILSSFNPTLTLSLPPQTLTTKPLPLHDLTPFLLSRRTCSDPAADRRSFKAAVKHILAHEQAHAPMTRATTRTGVQILAHADGERIAKWRVPWSARRAVRVLMDGAVVEMRTVPGGRGLEFVAGGATYVWRPGRERDEWVLEKRAREIGRYVVGVFLRKGGWWGEGGTLLVDARGVDVELAVVSVSVLGKRERQRWLVGGAAEGRG